MLFKIFILIFILWLVEAKKEKPDKTTEVLVIRVKPRGIGRRTLTTNMILKKDLRTVLAYVSEFFYESSFGKERYSFTVRDGFEESPFFSYRKNSVLPCCTETCSDPPDFRAIGNYITQRENLRNFNRIMFLFPYCPRAHSIATAETGGRQSWVYSIKRADFAYRKDYFAWILAHELGHNAGSGHATEGEHPYGNDYSVMGGGDSHLIYLDKLDFTYPVKKQFGWLPESPAISETVKLYAVDGSRRRLRKNTYGARLTSKITVEYRKKFGVLLVIKTISNHRTDLLGVVKCVPGERYSTKFEVVESNKDIYCKIIFNNYLYFF